MKMYFVKLQTLNIWGKRAKAKTYRKSHQMSECLSVVVIFSLTFPALTPTFLMEHNILTVFKCHKHVLFSFSKLCNTFVCLRFLLKYSETNITTNFTVLLDETKEILQPPQT